MTHDRETQLVGARLLAQGLLLGGVLGVLAGVLWWAITPDEEWLVTSDGVIPADPGGDSWFASDGWFAVIGCCCGAVLAFVMWQLFRRQTRDRVAGVGLANVLVSACAVGSGLVSVTAWSVGGFLGPDDPNDLVTQATEGAVLAGSLGVRATGVLLLPSLTALAVLAVSIATAHVTTGASPSTGPGTTTAESTAESGSF